MKWLSSLSSNTSGSAPDTAITDNHETNPREKGRYLTQSYDNLTTQKRHQNFDYTTILDTGWSVGVTTATQLVWLNQFTGSQPSYQFESELRPNAIFLKQCLSWSASFSSSFDFCSKEGDSLTLYLGPVIFVEIVVTCIMSSSWYIMYKCMPEIMYATLTMCNVTSWVYDVTNIRHQWTLLAKSLKLS